MYYIRVKSPKRTLQKYIEQETRRETKPITAKVENSNRLFQLTWSCWSNQTFQSRTTKDKSKSKRTRTRTWRTAKDSEHLQDMEEDFLVRLAALVALARRKSFKSILRTWMKHERGCFVKQFITKHTATNKHKHKHRNKHRTSQTEIHCRKLAKWQNNEARGVVVGAHLQARGDCGDLGERVKPLPHSSDPFSGVYYNSQHMNLVLNLNANCVCMQNV